MTIHLRHAQPLTGMVLAGLLYLAPAAVAATKQPELPATDAERKAYATDICGAISANASAHGLPEHFFARLIWKESLFDPGAVSPKGAQGIAQFMPGTAKRRDLDDPFDPKAALAASAAYLAELSVNVRQPRSCCSGLQFRRGSHPPLAGRQDHPAPGNSGLCPVDHRLWSRGVEAGNRESRHDHRQGRRFHQPVPVAW